MDVDKNCLNDVEIGKLDVSVVDEDQELVYTDKFSKSNDQYNIVRPILTSRPQPIGSVLVDFLDYDFEKYLDFLDFINNRGVSGLVDYSETARKLRNTVYTIEQYTEISNQIWQEVYEELAVVQNDFIKAIYYCLDINGPKWSRQLSPLHRYFIMSEKDRDLSVFWDCQGELKVRFIHNTRRSFLLTQDKKIELFLIREKPTTELEIASTIKDLDFESAAVYSSFNIATIMWLEFNEMLRINREVKKCKNCNRYFIPSRPNTEYCNRPINETDHRTCKDTGAMTRYTHSIKNDPITIAYRKAYKTAHARIFSSRKGPKTLEDKEKEFQDWTIEAKSLINAVKEGKIDIDTFIKWTKEVKSYGRID